MAQFIPHLLASAFTSNTQLINLAAMGLRINMFMFPIVGFQIVTSSLFQSIGKAKISAFMSLSRQVIFLIPMLIIIPRFVGLPGVWAAGPAADLIASITTFFILRWQLKKLAV
jgi:Na+-driven multidrug efflux pump